MNDSRTKRQRPSSPSWQRPTGVSQGNWEYVNSDSIAGRYAEFLAGDPLTQADGSLLRHYFPGDEAVSGQVIADYGCGNGRSLLPLCERGYRTVGVDLSMPMLKEFGKELAARDASSTCLRIRANLVQLEGVRDASFDGAVCLFSTLGMIQGRENRKQFLQHVRRQLKPNAPFLVHAHNLLFQTRHPGGLLALAKNAIGAVAGKNEFGDRTADYRGVRNLMIHSYRRRELAAELKTAGLKPTKWFGVSPDNKSLIHPLPKSHWFSMVGWLVECRHQ